MKHILRKTFLVLAAGIMSSAAWADVLPTPVYFNNFETAVSGSDGIEIVGNGVFESDADTRFGKIFHNDPGATPSKEIRKNYLRLPEDVLSHSTTTKEITIGFWVNVKNAADFWFSPIFSAYALSPAENAAESRLGNEGNFPMFVLQSRGLMQLNNGGWDDFAASDNVNGENQENTFWLDDKEWHYYTMTMTTSKAIVYVDGVVFNEWNINGTEAHYVGGFFEYGANYKHICLGGNQAWNWGDPDPAYGFDDFAVYDRALSASQIAQIIANKIPNATTKISETGWSTAAFNYPLDFTTSITGLSVYTVTGHTGTAITKAAVTGVVPAGTPLLLNGTASASYTIPVATTAGTAPAGNKLVRGRGAAVDATDGNTTYVLSKEGTKSVFKKIVSGTSPTVAADKAYLLFTGEAIEARSIDIDGDGTTGINMVNGEGLKVNGSEVYYDLQGRRVLYPTKGLYIVNGKKVILK